MGCEPNTRTSLAALLTAALLAGCAGAGSGGWGEYLFGSSAAQGEPQVAYVAAARTKVFSEPDEASPVTGVLTLHEKLERYQSDHGFAYVEAQGNVSGWVREQQLAATRPRVRPATQAAETATPPPAPSEPAAPTPPSAESPAPDTQAPEAEPPPAPEPEPVEPERSVFDPY